MTVIQTAKQREPSADFQVISVLLEIFLSSVKKSVATRKQVVKARELSHCSTEKEFGSKRI